MAGNWCRIPEQFHGWGFDSSAFLDEMAVSVLGCLATVTSWVCSGGTVPGRSAIGDVTAPLRLEVCSLSGFDSLTYLQVNTGASPG